MLWSILEELIKATHLKYHDPDTFWADCPEESCQKVQKLFADNHKTPKGA